MRRNEVKDKKYYWKQAGNPENRRIAVIAASNFLSQEFIQKRIAELVDLGFCVEFPVYKDKEGQEFLLMDPLLDRGDASHRIAGSGSPAVSDIDGASQIIEAIEAGIDMMPLMGGDSFEKKISIILQYFSENPEKKNMEVRFFGLSNSTYANFLSRDGICHFVATPFISVISEARRGDKRFFQVSQDLTDLLKGNFQGCKRKLKAAQEGFTVPNSSTSHYPMNIAPFIDFVENKFEEFEKPYSLEFEAFIESGTEVSLLNFKWILETLFKNHANNLPEFVVCSLITSRFDGNRGYARLSYDENGLIELSEDNCERIFQNSSQLKEYISTFAEEIKKDSAPSEYRQDVLDIIESGKEFTRQDVFKIMQYENDVIIKRRQDIAAVCSRFNVPLLFSSDFGHAANMSIIPSGESNLAIREGGEVVMHFSLKALSREDSPTAVASSPYSPNVGRKDLAVTNN